MVHHWGVARFRSYLGGSRPLAWRSSHRHWAQVSRRGRSAGTLWRQALPLALDVTDPAQVPQVVRQAHEHFGKLDVLVNNAGSSLIATAEEATDDHLRALFDANFFGMVRVLRAALPLLRQQGFGHILGVSSSVGVVPMPFIGFYAATKSAVEAIHDSMAQEVKAFGIKVTLIEPGAYATEFGKSARRADEMDAYAQLRKDFIAKLMTHPRGDPQATAEAILKVVDAENPPRRLILGSDTLPMVRAAYAERLATWEAWEAVSNAAQGPSKRNAIAD